MEEQKKKQIKLVVVGDGASGKTSMLITFAHNEFPSEYIPTVFDNYIADIVIDGKPVSIALWDTAGPEEYDRLRPLSYTATDVFMILFSCYSTTAYENVAVKWYLEVTHYCPGVPIILVSTKTDLRLNQNCIEKIRAQGTQFVTPEQGIQMAKRIKAVAYCEISSLTKVGVKAAFEEVARAVLYPRMKKGKKKNKFTFSKLFTFSLGSKKGEDSLEYKHMPEMPSPLYGHTSTVIGDRLYVVGGCDAKGEFLKSVLVYHLRLGRWLPPLEQVEVPPIQFHTTVLHNEILYIFGGKSNGYRNESYSLDVNKIILTKIEAKGPIPTPRYGHSAVVYQDKIYVFGGYDNTAMACNDLYSFDIATSTWDKAAIQGAAPPSRFMHSAVVNNKSMFVFGGCGDSSAILGDLFEFNFGDFTWTKLKIKGKTPAPRYGHAVEVSNLGMYIFGGMDKAKEKSHYFADALYWEFAAREFRALSVQITPRANHSCASDRGVAFIITGGKRDSDVLADTFGLSPLQCFVDILPMDIVTHILSFVSIDDFVSLYITSKKMHHACNNERLWEHFCTQLIPHLVDIARERDAGIPSYRQFLIDNYISPDLVCSIPKVHAKVAEFN